MNPEAEAKATATAPSRKQRRTRGRSRTVLEQQRNAPVVELLRKGFRPEVGESSESATRRLFIEAGAKSKARKAARRKSAKAARRRNR